MVNFSDKHSLFYNWKLPFSYWAWYVKLYCAWSSFLQNWDRCIINKIYYYLAQVLGRNALTFCWVFRRSTWGMKSPPLSHRSWPQGLPPWCLNTHASCIQTPHIHSLKIRELKLLFLPPLVYDWALKPRMYRSPFSWNSRSVKKTPKKQQTFSNQQLLFSDSPKYTWYHSKLDGKEWWVKERNKKSKYYPLFQFYKVCWTFESSGLGKSKTTTKSNKTGGHILLKHHDWLPSQINSSCWSSVDGKVATHRFPSTFCAGHAWRSPGTAPLCLARCALPTPPPDTGHKVGHAWQHSTGISPLCPVQCALLTPPDRTKSRSCMTQSRYTPPCSARCALLTPHLTQDRMQVMHDTVQVQLPMPSTMCSPSSSTRQDKKQVMHDTVQVHICLCPAPPPDTGQKTGHAWHSPGTHLSVPSTSTWHRTKNRSCMTQPRYNSPVLSLLLHQTLEKKQAMHDNTVQVQLSWCPAWHALLTLPPDTG